MKKRLQRIYWIGILLTIAVSLFTVVLLMWIKVSDTREYLFHTLNTASAWTLESNDNLQDLAESIANVAHPVRVTFLMNQGLVLADSEREATEMGSHADREEIIEAMQGKVGESMRLSVTQDEMVIYAAKRISPQLILRLAYPIWELSRVILLYGAGLVLLFLLLFLHQRRALSRFAGSLIAQMDDVRLMLEGQLSNPKAVFPELQPALNNIAYLADRMEKDRKEILRTLNMRQDFVANASHELRSPLTSIMGFAEMLDEGLADTPEEQALCTQTIRSECSRMLEVIEDILLLSRAERQLAEPAAVDVAAVAEEICQSLSPRAAQRNITLKVEGSFRLTATEKDVWEILYNLTDNAIRYGREGGYVHIRLGPDGFSVEDNGIGIDAAHQSRIFEQFYRVDEVRSAVGGTGLGLSIIQAIVQRYGGEIHLVSESGKGSRFIVQFGSPEGAQ